MAISCKDRHSGVEWPVAGGSPDRMQYSTLSEIDTSNVADLELLWTYRTNDAADGSQIQCNPIVVGGTLYATSPRLTLFALDARTGERKWEFSPADSVPENLLGMNTNRGVTFWTDGNESRILYVVGSRLIAVDAVTGKADRDFGDNGSVDLSKGLGRDVSNLYITATSPGVVYEDLFIVGSRVSEANPSAPGHIRAYDVRSGELAWVFHTIPQPGEFGYDTWEDSLAYLRVGGANSWSGLSLDTERGWVFAATGSAAFDFYGGDRKGDNLFANCVLAIDAKTGRLQWHYQTIHHDVWDRDLPAPPVLTSITVDGQPRDVAIQATKTGYLFVLDRQSGKPVFEIDEVQVPSVSSLTGESLSATQPIPRFPEPFMRQEMTFEELKQLISDSSFAELQTRLNGFRSGDLFTPPSEEGTVFFPGLDGGAEWGGSSFDREAGILYINANEVPWIITNVKKVGDPRAMASGSIVYQEYCMSCHGPELEGAGNYPELLDISNRYDANAIRKLFQTGKGMMPAFSFLSDDEAEAVIDYVLNYRPGQKANAVDSSLFRGYAITGYHKLQTLEGLPAIDPPWGTLNAIDIHSGKVKWKVALGRHPELDSIPYSTGSENYGGPVATNGGLIFIAGTPDRMFRVFRKRDGKILWETELPAGGFATPAVYEAGGKQIVVIACGGGKLGTSSGDYYVAFGLN